jgi:hypothetical protein
MAFDYYYQGDLLYIGTNANLAQRELNTLVEARHVWLVVNRHPSIAGETEVTENWFAQNGVLINSYTYPQFLNIYEMEFSDP